MPCPLSGSLSRTISPGSSAPRRQAAVVRSVGRRSLLVCIEMITLLGWLAAGTPLLLRPAASATHQAADSLDRTVLPIPEPRPPLITELDARDAKAPPRFEVKAP